MGHGAVDRRSAERGGYVYLGLRGADETNELAWKRFNPNAQLSVTCNYPPSVLSRRLDSPNVPCVTDHMKAPIVRVANPNPTIEIREPDNTNVFAEFEVNLTGETLPRYRGRSAIESSANGADFQPQTPLWDQVFDRPLLSNRVWAWRARANDGIAASPWCYFMIDTTHPPAPKITVVTAGPNEIGHAITVRFEPNGAAVRHGRRGRQVLLAVLCI